MKQCSKCGEVKAADQFPKRTSMSSPRPAKCRDCVAAYARQYHQANAEQRAARARAWNAAHPDRIRQRVRARNARPDVQERRREVERQRYAADPERHRAYQRDWQRAHNGAKQIAALKFRLKRLGRGDEPVLTVDEWNDLCARHNNRCAACQVEGPLTIDHIVPVSRMGASTINNIQPLCRPCNARKYTAIVDHRNGEGVLTR